MFRSVRSKMHLTCVRSVLPKRCMSALGCVLKYNVGDKIFGYTVKQVNQVPELNLAALRLEHEQSGAEHLHLAREDNNNCFSVSVMTPVQNNCGIPHILEHLALCGSRNYRCRDPFFKMLNRSLATFMNAFTGHDCTMYPFCTQNSKDFENLLHVYLDAVFFPNLYESDFRQEGWRLEHEDPKDKNSPIVIKGVVFNEMKGFLSDPNQYYARCLLNELCPSHTYSYESGGDPLSIPDLSREELVNYHAEHYHPSNSRFFTYGNMPVENHLRIIENCVLENFNDVPVKCNIPTEKRWAEPKVRSLSHGVGMIVVLRRNPLPQKEVLVHTKFDPLAADPEKQTTVSVSYLLNSVAEPREAFALSLLTELLLDGPSAPFHRALIEPGLGPDYSPGAGYNDQQKESFFSVGLRQVSAKDVQTVTVAIHSTFDELMRTGLPKERVEAQLHSVELATKHQTDNFGLGCAMGVNTPWSHGGDPIEALRINDHVRWFRDQMKDHPRFLQDKIAQYFQNNRHRLTLVMAPKDASDSEERERLSQKLACLSEEDRRRIHEEGLRPERQDDASCLPCLGIDDVQREQERTLVQRHAIAGVPVQLCVQPTNEVVYFRAVAELGALPQDQLMLLPLFCYALTRMGAGDRDHRQFEQEAQRRTSGLSVAPHLAPHPLHPHRYQKGVFFSSYCLQGNVDSMFSLWEDVFNRARLEDERLLSRLVGEMAAELAQSVVPHGHEYAMRCACSSLTSCASLQEKISGLRQVTFMKKLAEYKNLEEVAAKLNKIAATVLRRGTLRCSVNACPRAVADATRALESFVGAVPEGPALPEQGAAGHAVSKKSHFVLPLSVNFLGKGIAAVPYAHPDFASLKTAARLLSVKFLHREVREKIGAYGVGASLTNGGLFRFYSYRDPGVGRTLSSFEEGVAWLARGDCDERDVDEARLAVFAEIDRPVAAGARGSAPFLHGLTEEMRAEVRRRLFALGKRDVVAAARRYLVDPEHNGITLIGPECDVSETSDWTRQKE